MAKVTGIGRVFIKCSDPEKLSKWYSSNLDLRVH